MKANLNFIVHYTSLFISKTAINVLKIWRKKERKHNYFSISMKNMQIHAAWRRTQDDF